jgi:hypothetical protein
MCDNGGGTDVPPSNIERQSRRKAAGCVQTDKVRLHDQPAIGGLRLLEWKEQEARKFNYGSPVRQCEQALKAVFTPGVSRHAEGRWHASERIYPSAPCGRT